MNGFFKMFLNKMGPGTRYKDVPIEFLDRYRDVLPKDLLEFWAAEGLSSYADGLFWTVDPEEYLWVAEEWVANYPEIPLAGLHVFARNSYGEFYCLSLEGGCVIKISCPAGEIYAPRSMLKLMGGAERAAEVFFGMASRAKFDLLDTNRDPLFPRALVKLGPLDINEVYGFVPMITLGGETCVSNLDKLRMDVHLDMLRASREPRLLLI